MRNGGHGFRPFAKRSLHSFGALSADVFLHLGDVSYSYIVSWLLQWSNRYDGIYQSSPETAELRIEGLILGCTCMIISGFYGPQIWTRPITDLINRPDIFGNVSVIDIWIPMLLVTFLTAHLPACVYNVIQARKAHRLPVAPVFLEWTPMLVYTSAIAAWLYSPYSTLMRDNRLVLFCLTMSFVFGRMTTKIILAHLTRQPFPYWTVMLIPLLGGAILGNLPRVGLPAIDASVELWYLRSYFVFAVVVYFRWAFLVINSICGYLGINCLTIPSKTKNNQENGKLRTQAKDQNSLINGANGRASRKAN